MPVNDMIERTSTREAPWTLVEANDKNFARIKVLKTMCDRLERGSPEREHRSVAGSGEGGEADDERSTCSVRGGGVCWRRQSWPRRAGTGGAGPFAEGGAPDLKAERALAATVSETRMVETVRRLVGFGTRMYGTPSNHEAAAWLAGAFERPAST